MITKLLSGLRGGIKGCRDVYGEMLCPFCHSKRVKYEGQQGHRLTRWSCKDWRKHPHEHAYGYTWVYDRSNFNDIQVNGRTIHGGNKR